MAAIPAACKAAFEKMLNEESVPLSDEFATIDLDSNGSIDFEEMRQLIRLEYRDLFLDLDKDVDGYLVTTELSSFQSDFEPVVSEACEKALEMEDVKADARELRIVMAQFDENNDKKISLDEFLNNQNESVF